MAAVFFLCKFGLHSLQLGACPQTGLVSWEVLWIVMLKIIGAGINGTVEMGGLSLVTRCSKIIEMLDEMKRNGGFLECLKEWSCNYILSSLLVATIDRNYFCAVSEATKNFQQQ